MGDRDESSTAAEAGIDRDQRERVTALLTAAGLSPPADEIDRLAALYPGLRRSIDRFHQVDVGDEVAAAVFRAGEFRVDDLT